MSVRAGRTKSSRALPPRVEKISAAEAEREYAQRDPAREETAPPCFSKGFFGHAKRRGVVFVLVRSDDDFNILIEFHQKAQQPFN